MARQLTIDGTVRYSDDPNTFAVVTGRTGTMSASSTLAVVREKDLLHERVTVSVRPPV